MPFRACDVMMTSCNDCLTLTNSRTNTHTHMMRCPEDAVVVINCPRTHVRNPLIGWIRCQVMWVSGCGCEEIMRSLDNERMEVVWMSVVWSINGIQKGIIRYNNRSLFNVDYKRVKIGTHAPLIFRHFADLTVLMLGVFYVFFSTKLVCIMGFYYTGYLQFYTINLQTVYIKLHKNVLTVNLSNRNNTINLNSLKQQKEYWKFKF